MPHDHAPYPSLSLECVSDVIRMIRGRTVRDEIPLFAKHAYTLAGAGLKYYPGEPDGVPIIAGDEAPEPSVEQVKEAVAALEEFDAQQPRGADDPAGNPLVSLLVQVAIAAFMKWLEKRSR